MTEQAGILLAKDIERWHKEGTPPATTCHADLLIYASEAWAFICRAMATIEALREDFEPLMREVAELREQDELWQEIADPIAAGWRKCQQRTERAEAREREVGAAAAGIQELLRRSVRNLNSADEKSDDAPASACAHEEEAHRLMREAFALSQTLAP